MAELAFPSSPAPGDIFEGRWQWDSEKWVPAPGGGGGGGGASSTVSDTMPATARPGDMWWDTVSAKLFLWDGDQWIIVVNTPSGDT